MMRGKGSRRGRGEKRRGGRVRIGEVGIIRVIQGIRTSIK